MKVGKDLRSLSLTPSACPCLEVLAKRLHQLQKKLQTKLFIIGLLSKHFKICKMALKLAHFSLALHSDGIRHIFL